MPQTKNQKITSIVLCFCMSTCLMLKLFFPVLQHNPSISLEHVHTSVIKLGNENYIAREIGGTITVNITNAGVFARGFLTDDHLNAIIMLAIQSSVLCLVITLLLKKSITPVIFGSIGAIIFLYVSGCIYTYFWFQINGGAFAQSGYRLVLPYERHLASFILVGLLFYWWVVKVKPVQQIINNNY